MRKATRDGLAAGSVAAALSGVPSTMHALATGRDLRESTIAAGSIVLPQTDDEELLLAAGVPVHVAISLFWGVALARILPPRRPAAAVLLGAFAGAGIHVLDAELLGSLFPRIRALPRGPQLADHVAFGTLVGAVLARRRR